MALHRTHPEIMAEEAVAAKMKYPRPVSEPPSPSSSRAHTPNPSEHGSDNEEETVDEQDEIEREILSNPESEKD